MYSIQEYAADPVAAVPLKTVHFIYKPSGKLCSGVPNSIGDGKLTWTKCSLPIKIQTKAGSVLTGSSTIRVPPILTILAR